MKQGVINLAYFLMFPIAILLLHSMHLFAKEYRGYHKPWWLQSYSLVCLLFVPSGAALPIFKILDELTVPANVGTPISAIIGVIVFGWMIYFYKNLEKDT